MAVPNQLGRVVDEVGGHIERESCSILCDIEMLLSEHTRLSDSTEEDAYMPVKHLGATPTVIIRL